MNILDPMREGLFREDAINSRKSNQLSEIILNISFPTKLAAIASGIIFMMLLTMAIYGDYTKKSTVFGQVVPSSGIVRVYSPLAGVVSKKYVEEGMFVRKGDPLYEVENVKISFGQLDINEKVNEAIRKRIALVDEEIDSAKISHEKEVLSIESKRKHLESRIPSIEYQIKILESKLSGINDSIERYTRLHKKGFVSKDQLQQKIAERYEESSKLAVIREEKNSMIEKILENNDALSLTKSKFQSTLKQMERHRIEILQQFFESESRSFLTVVSPSNGIATAVLGEVGQYFDATRPMLGIVPDGNTFQVDLYVPGNSIGLIEEGVKVNVKFDAYPYQKFGMYPGIVKSVSKTPMSIAELSSISGGVPGANLSNPGELYFRVVVYLKSQTIRAYGKDRFLTSGLSVKCDISQEKRKIYEWIIDPVLSFKSAL